MIVIDASVNKRRGVSPNLSKLVMDDEVNVYGLIECFVRDIPIRGIGSSK